MGTRFMGTTRPDKVPMNRPDERHRTRAPGFGILKTSTVNKE